MKTNLSFYSYSCVGFLFSAFQLSYFTFYTTYYFLLILYILHSYDDHRFNAFLYVINQQLPFQKLNSK